MLEDFRSFVLESKTIAIKHNLGCLDYFDEMLNMSLEETNKLYNFFFTMDNKATSEPVEQKKLIRSFSRRIKESICYHLLQIKDNFKEYKK